MATNSRSAGAGAGAETCSFPISLRINEALNACSHALETGDFAGSDAAVARVVGLLDSPAADSGITEVALTEIDQYLSSPSSNQTVVDALAFELPKVVVKFVSLSDRCRETAVRIVDRLVSVCNPRDMLSILCEALDTLINISNAPVSYIPLLTGISKVILCIRRNHTKQIQVALSVILKVLRAVSSELDEEDKDSLNDIFGAAVDIGNSIQTTCKKMMDRSKEELRTILGLYVLENIALISRSRKSDIVLSRSLLVLQLSQFLPFCGLSYLGLITGSDVPRVTEEAFTEDDDDFKSCFLLTLDGASLAVIWGHISDEIAQAADEHLSVILEDIQDNRTKRWQAIGMLRSTLSSIDYPWEIKSHSIEILLTVMDGKKSEDPNDCRIDISFMPTLFAALKGIERIMIGASDASLRKKAFDVLRKIVSDLPSTERFEILKALISASNSPSMISILFGLVKEEIFLEIRQRSTSRNNETNQLQNRTLTSPFLSSDAVELVESVLKPPKGGPPSLPEYTEPVLAALNLYRFLLMVESAEKTNFTGVLSEKMLKRAYCDWLLPLRTLVAGIQAENEKDDSEIAENIRRDLNPVQLVLHHCIELVEANQKHSK